MESHMPISCLTRCHPPFEIRFKLGSKKSQLDIWAKQKSQPYFPLNPGCLTGVLISWFMKKSLHNWVPYFIPYIPGKQPGSLVSLLIRNFTEHHQESPTNATMPTCNSDGFSIFSPFPFHHGSVGSCEDYPWLYLRDKFDKPSTKKFRGILNNLDFNDSTEKMGVRISDFCSHLSKIRRPFLLNCMIVGETVTRHQSCIYCDDWIVNIKYLEYRLAASKLLIYSPTV